MKLYCDLFKVITFLLINNALRLLFTGEVYVRDICECMGLYFMESDLWLLVDFGLGFCSLADYFDGLAYETYTVGKKYYASTFDITPEKH